MGTTVFDHTFYPGDANGLTFLAALSAVEGDATYGDAATVGEYAYATSATNSTMQAEAVTFWAAGVPDAGSSTPKTGLSASTPFEFFEAFRSDLGANGTWRYADGDAQTGTTVTGLNFAKGLRALGSSFRDVWAWLMTFTSNPTYQSAPGVAPKALAAAQTGDYDPTLALATTLCVAGSYANQNASSLYEWATTGLLAAFSSSLKAAKDAIAVPRVRYNEPTPRQAETDYVGMRGRSGLSFQVSFYDSNVTRHQNVVSAAMLMAAYRYAPQTFGLKDSP